MKINHHRQTLKKGNRKLKNGKEISVGQNKNSRQRAVWRKPGGKCKTGLAYSNQLFVH